MREPTVERFLKDVSVHQMTVLRDDGLYRHIHFAQHPNGWNQWFDLITWPGFLAITGDMGAWMFSRVEDMFTFFRSRDSELRINPSYWAEKIQGGVHGGTDSAKVYSDEAFSRALLEQLSGYYGLEGDDLAEVTQAVKDEVLSSDFEWDAKIAARDFEHQFQDDRKFRFDPCELPSGRDYAYHYIWCLYAIVWGIQRWDARHNSGITSESAISEGAQA